MATTVYDGGHNQANMTLDGVTIGVEGNTPIPLAGGHAKFQTDLCVNHEVILSIRVHTAWAHAPHNRDQTVQILDSVITKLKRNLRLDEYYVAGFSAPDYRAEFHESGTRGGQVNFALHVLTEYRQE